MTAKELNIIDNNEYQQWLQQLCTEIDKQRLKAAMQLNAATLQHYWWLGNDIIRQQKEQGWGAKVIDQLSVDLQKFCKRDLQNSPFQQMESLCKCRLHKSHGITIYLCSLR